MSPLTPPQYERLRDAMVDAFDADGLSELVRFNLPYRLDMLVDRSRGLNAVVLDLIQALDQRGELGVLLRGAVRARPNKADLIAMCREVAPEAFEAPDTGALVTRVAAGIRALTDLKDAPAVWAKVGEFQAIFRAVMVQTGLLAAYKALHDGLHNLQMRLAAIEVAAASFVTAASQARLLAQQAVFLKGDADRASTQAARLPTRMQEDDWIEELRDAAGEIGLSLESRDAERMGRAVGVLRRLLQETYRIDGQMAASAGQLPLGDLIAALDAIVRQSAREDDGKAGATAGRVEAARDALTVLRPQLEGLVVEHGEWQLLNKALAGVEINPGFRPEEKVNRWAKVKPRLEALCGAFGSASWASDLLAEIAKWEQAAAAGEADRGEVAANQVYASASSRFFDVDQDLLRLCGQLTDIGSPIESLLGTLTANRG